MRNVVRFVSVVGLVAYHTSAPAWAKTTPDTEESPGDETPAPEAAKPVSEAVKPASQTDATPSDAAAQGQAPAQPAVIKPAPEGQPKPETPKVEAAPNFRALGSMSIGKPSAGLLENGVQMPKGDAWVFAERGNAWGTQSSVDDLVRCLSTIYERFPNTPKVVIGHLSAQHGGKLSPHLSHQSGRDADVGFYYKGDKIVWYERATADNLDRARTWALIREFITTTDVEFILIDQSVQVLLREYAVQLGEDSEWLKAVFEGDKPRQWPIIRHVPGHTGHMHVRFHNKNARQRARDAYDSLVKHGVISPGSYNKQHKVQKGDTLIGLSKRYKVSVEKIQEANGMKNTVLKLDQTYKIPQQRKLTGVFDPIIVQPPTLPPSDKRGEERLMLLALEAVRESLKDWPKVGDVVSPDRSRRPVRAKSASPRVKKR